MPSPPPAADLSPVRCPACAVPLRLRERRFVGATFPCPECQEPLILLALEANRPVLQRATVLATGPTATAPATTAAPRALRWPTVSPLLVVWSLASLVAVVLVGLAFCDRFPTATPTAEVIEQPQPAAPAITERQPPEPQPEPTTTETPTVEVVATPAVTTPATPPVEPVPHEPPVSAAAVTTTVTPVVATKPDPQVLLEQRLVSFQQAKPVSRRDLLRTVEDLLDRPIHLGEDIPADVSARLDLAITLSLEQVTVAELLRAILNGTQLEFVCTSDDVRLQVAKP
jgi:hypothetical protein